MRGSRRPPLRPWERRRLRRQHRSLAAAIVVMLGAGLFSAVSVDAEAGKTGPTERTFTVTCEFGVCTFTAGQHPRTASHTTYEWDWGDGTTDTGQVVSHLFVGDDDSYTVKLTSINDFTGEELKERITCVREPETLVVTSCG